MAIKACRRALVIDRQYRDPELYYSLGISYLHTGDRKSAAIQFELLQSKQSDLAEKLSAELNKHSA
jgi:hypothetical protein